MKDVANTTLGDHPLNRQKIWIPAAILVAGEAQSALLRQGNQPIGLGGGQAERLLDDSALPREQRAAGKLGVRAGWRADDHRINIRIVIEILHLAGDM